MESPKDLTIETMQIRLFTIPIGDSGSALDEMNNFLRGNKILEVENQRCLRWKEEPIFFTLLMNEAHFGRMARNR